jgi:hypothetical protein
MRYLFIRKIMLRIISCLAEHFPGHYFYSTEFLINLRWSFTEDADAGTPLLNSLRNIMIGVAVAAGRNLKKPGDSMVATFTSVTDCGRDVGHFRVTVQRIFEVDADK